MSDTATVGYRSIATREVLVWGLAALANKLPIAMAPLAFVFLARELPGGYTLGATLAAVWVIAEVVGAPLLGMWFSPRHARIHLGCGLGLGAVSYAVLGFGQSLPTWLLFAVTFLSGFGPAASPGGMRALLTNLVPERDAPKVLSAEAVLNGLVWAAAPALVAVLALQAGPGVPMALGAVLDVAAVALVFLLPELTVTDDAESAQHTGSRARTLVSAWPIYLTAAASMAMVSTMELVLPALLESKGIPVATVAPLLVVFWVGSVVGGFLYGRRTWPGTVRAQGFVVLLITITAISLVAVLPGVVAIGATLAVGGIFQSCVLVTRNLSLRRRLPAAAHTAGYAIMYATTGVGYSIVAVTAALVMAHASPTVAILGGGVISVVIVLASGLAERGGARAVSGDVPAG
ncbi:MFS transporter [Amycolatopsis sp. NPDC059021]|uniref:MFS transporter n=1 Tax=Amycolatopsis sp. NPDC059021 TaxID=3346704 RepID=UPI00366D0637